MPQKLPVILSPEEVQEFLGCVQHIEHRTILSVCYAAGLRISEAVHLKPTDIDSKRIPLSICDLTCLISRRPVLAGRLH